MCTCDRDCPSTPATCPPVPLSAPAAPTGRGQTRAKFLPVGGGLQPQADSTSNLANTTAGGANTVSSGSASWNSFHAATGSGVLFGAWLDGSASVTTTGAPAANPGRSVGSARDPLEFTVSGPGTLEYTALVGDLRFKADHALARNRLSISASFNNVRAGAVPLDGPLWTLDIQSTGLMSSTGAIVVNLWVWPALGISQAQIDAAEVHLRNQLEPLGGGYFGYPGDLPVFGPGGPLPAIHLDYSAGTIRYGDDLILDAQLPALASAVPAQTRTGAIGLALVLLSCVALAWRRKRARSSAAVV